ncbi:hypothetical protein LCGC14_1675830 [marine sediment metagenome]|uniref:Uncharacterized protein n=1 Tax=marine sediment metagenome TaxID=412755 RepID=A0A0F9K5Q1_9ZZZZ
MTQTRRIPRAVLREAVKKTGNFYAGSVISRINGLGADTDNLSGLTHGLKQSVRVKARRILGRGFHYSPDKPCDKLTLKDFVECWSGDVNNPTVTRHKVGNCRVEV